MLVTGESGTGKDLVSRSIHFNSKRAAKPYVTVNCAAIPETLLESVLFGHVKGAFTGATHNKMGEFQKADGGTLFLDELGELPLMLQAKVLRAIEQGEVSPVGSNDAPLRVDVRLICATNRNLAQMVREGRFPRRPLLPRTAGEKRKGATCSISSTSVAAGSATRPSARRSTTSRSTASCASTGSCSTAPPAPAAERDHSSRQGLVPLQVHSRRALILPTESVVFPCEVCSLTRIPRVREPFRVTRVTFMQWRVSHSENGVPVPGEFMNQSDGDPCSCPEAHASCFSEVLGLVHERVGVGARLAELPVDEGPRVAAHPPLDPADGEERRTGAEDPKRDEEEPRLLRQGHGGQRNPRVAPWHQSAASTLRALPARSATIDE